MAYFGYPISTDEILSMAAQELVPQWTALMQLTAFSVEIHLRALLYTAILDYQKADVRQMVLACRFHNQLSTDSLDEYLIRLTKVWDVDTDKIIKHILEISRSDSNDRWVAIDLKTPMPRPPIFVGYAEPNVGFWLDRYRSENNFISAAVLLRRYD